MKILEVEIQITVNYRDYENEKLAIKVQPTEGESFADTFREARTVLVDQIIPDHQRRWQRRWGMVDTAPSNSFPFAAQIASMQQAPAAPVEVVEEEEKEPEEIAF